MGIKGSGSTSEALLATDRASLLVELVDIAPGGVVSRVLASSSGGTVTLFAFDGGQGLSEHSAPFDALVHLLDGKLEVTIGGVSVPLDPGEMVRMPANVPHALAAPKSCRMLLTMLKEPKLGD